MKTVTLFVVTLGVVISPAVTNAASKRCKDLQTEYQKSGASCFCGADLSNLQATLPPGLKIEAACELGGSEQINLRHQQVSLDSDPPVGTIYLSGEITLRGSVSIDPGNAGDMWFSTLSPPPAAHTPDFYHQSFQELKLDWERDHAKFRAPKPAAIWRDCWHADATINVRDPVVSLWDNDSGGTYSQYITVIEVSGNKCVR